MIGLISKIKKSLLFFLSLFISTTFCFAEEPALVLKENNPAHFFSGDQVSIKVSIENILKIEKIFTLHWVLTAGESVVLKDKITSYELQKNEIIFKIQFIMPKVKRKTRLVLGMSIDIQGKHLKRIVNLDLYPTGQLSELNNICTNHVIGVYDPLNSLIEVLQENQLNYKKLSTPFEIEPFLGDLLIIGEDAISRSMVNISSVIEGKLIEGVNVIVLQQKNSFYLERIEIFPEEVQSRIDSIRILAKGHEIFAEISPGDIIFWQPEGIISKWVLKKPEQGNIRIIADDSGNQGALIEELIFGKARLVMYQIPFVDIIEKEPVAQILFNNLIFPIWSFVYS